MLDHLIGTALIEKAKKSGYEVRYANSWSAYEWLSQ